MIRPPSFNHIRFAFARLRGYEVVVYPRGRWQLTAPLSTDYLWIKKGAVLATFGYPVVWRRRMALAGTISNPYIYTVRREQTRENKDPSYSDVYWVAKGASRAIDRATAPLFIARHQGREIDSAAKQRAEALAALLNTPRDYDALG